MKYFFEAQEDDLPLYFSLNARNLSEATRVALAYLSGAALCDRHFELTSATAYKRKGITYVELTI